MSERTTPDAGGKTVYTTAGEYPEKPEESASPNTPARLADPDYQPPEPPDVYQQRPQDSPNIRRKR